MIKFFRKIREQLLSQNRFSKYMLYALGEIVLVVIGILIAVQLNNWNNSRVKDNELNELLIDLSVFLDTQKDIMSRDMSITKKVDSLLNVTLSDSLNKNQLNKLPLLESILFNPSEIPFKNIPEHQIGFSNIDNLIKRKQDFPKRFWSMIYELESLKVYSQDIKHYSGLASEVSKNYRDFLLENNPDIFVSDSTKTLTFNQRLLTEPTSRIRLTELREYLTDLGRAYDYYNFNSASLNARIKHLTQSNGVEIIEALWDEYNLNSLQLASCTIEDNNKNNLIRARRQRYLVFNNITSTIQFEIIDMSGEIIRSQTLKGKGVDFLHTTGKPNVFLRLIKNDSCFILMEPKPFSYFIIE